MIRIVTWRMAGTCSVIAILLHLLGTKLGIGAPTYEDAAVRALWQVMGIWNLYLVADRETL